MRSNNSLFAPIHDIFSDNSNWLPILTGALIGEFLVILYLRFFAGAIINSWYTEFRMTAVLLDVASILTGLFLLMIIFHWLGGKNMWLFLLLVLVFQMIHDLLFAILVILPSHSGQNQILDSMKKYANGYRYGAILGDTLTVLLYVLLMMLIKANVPIPIQVFLLTLSIYAIPYLVYRRASG